MSLMKTTVGAALLFLAGTFLPTAQAASVDFTPLAGQYKATYALALSSSTFTSSNLKVTVTPSKSGKSARMEIVGFIGTTPSSANYAAVGNIVFSTQKVAADNALLAFYIQLPSTVLASSSKNKVSFTLTNAILGPSSAITITYTLRFNKNRFSIIGTGTVGTDPVAVVLKGKKVSE